MIFRWGIGTKETHGDFYSGPDRYDPGKLLPHKWENAMTIDSTPGASGGTPGRTRSTSPTRSSPRSSFFAITLEIF